MHSVDDVPDRFLSALAKRAPGLRGIAREAVPGREDVRMTRPMLNQWEAAAVCGVSRSTIRRRREAGDLPGSVSDEIRGWLIPVDDLLTASSDAVQAAMELNPSSTRVMVRELDRSAVGVGRP